MKHLFFVLTVFFCLLSGIKAEEIRYPAIFPEEWKKIPLYESEYRELEPGVTYCHYHFKDMDGKPLSMYLIIVEWDKANVKMKVGVAKPGLLQSVRSIVKKDQKDLVAAVNGAYFNFVPPVTYFYTKSEGKVYHPREENKDRWSTGLVFNDDEYPQLVQGNQENLDKYNNMLQGYWLGKNGVNPNKSRIKKNNKEGTPYTIVGLNPAKKLLVLWVNDGRFPKESPGIGFWEIPEYMFKLDCPEVLSIDGGGSCTVVLPEGNKLKVMNHPSDNKQFDHNGERLVQNCLYIVRSNKKK